MNFSYHVNILVTHLKNFSSAQTLHSINNNTPSYHPSGFKNIDYKCVNFVLHAVLALGTMSFVFFFFFLLSYFSGQNIPKVSTYSRCAKKFPSFLRLNNISLCAGLYLCSLIMDMQIVSSISGHVNCIHFCLLYCIHNSSFYIFLILFPFTSTK